MESRVSSAQIISKVERDFAIPFATADVNNIIEWIGEALGQIGVTVGLKGVTKECTVDNFRAAFPCNVECVTAITHNDLTIDVVKPTAFDFKRASSNKMVYFNFPYLECNFNNTRIKIHYYTFDVCDNGFPLIPDNAFLKEALLYYVIMKMLSRGYKHPVFTWDLARQMWTDAYPRAQNAIKFPTIMSMENFTKTWTSLIPYTNRNFGSFTNSEDGPVVDEIGITSQNVNNGTYETY